MDLLLESDEEDFGSNIELIDNEPDSNTPPTTRWNQQNDDYYYRGRDRVSLVDPNPLVGSAASSKSEKRKYRQWHSRVVRSVGSRVVCWEGSVSNKLRSLRAEDLQKFCFVCKLDLETDPGHLKSFPVRAWMQAADRGCPNCQQIVLGVRLAADTFGLAVEILQLATMRYYNPSAWYSASKDAVENVERINIALFWVDPTGDNSEGLQFERQKKLPSAAEIAATEKKAVSLVAEEYQLKCFRQARELLKKCDCEHTCQRPSGFLPTRLVDLHGEAHDSSVKVIRSGSIQPKSGVGYAALSYCWGKVLPLRLLQSSLQQMEAGIAWDQLPRLFQDAVVFTRSLNLRYIWIDAMCIIQDDREDWERESAQMGDIYYYSYVTIGATSSRDSTNALTVTPFCGISLEPKEESQSYGHVKVRTMGGDLTWPLHHRGWAYQEILLPGRYLDFDSNALSLHCCQGTERAADNPLPYDRTRSSDEYYREWGNHIGEQNFRQPWSFRWFWARISSGFCKDAKGKRIEMWQAWQEVVMMYTNRRLTFTSDRLPAIGGLAAEYLRCSEPAEEYCAGIWKSSFIEHLAWKTCFHNEVHTSEYQAPSWSWASVSNIVDYDTQNYRFEDRRRVYTKVKEVSITKKKSNPFGSVTGGFVVLEGPITWCIMKQSSESGRESPGHFSLRNLDSYVSDVFLSDTELERVEISLGADGVLFSARRIKGNSESSSTAAVGECKVCLLHLYGGLWTTHRTCMVLGVVDVVEDECVFQRLGLVTLYMRISDDKELPVNEVKII